MLADWNRSDMHLTSGVVSVVRVRRSYMSVVHERRWPTQAQLMRILRNIDVLGRECLWSLVPLSLRKVSQHVCVSSLSVGQSVSPRVCVRVRLHLHLSGTYLR